MNWDSILKSFELYIRLEKGLSENSVGAYLRDIRKLANYALDKGRNLKPSTLSYEDLSQFIAYLDEEKLSPHSRARVTSSIRTFFKFLSIEKIISHTPSELLNRRAVG